MASQTTKGEERVAQMAALVEKVQYTMEVADSLPTLEEFVAEQVKDQIYHLETNLAVLKIYQYHPESVKIPVVVQILLKSLMALPANHFSLCAFQLSKAILRDPQVETVFKIADLLETADFLKFWALADSQAELLDIVPGFADAVREHIIGLLSRTYQTINKKLLQDTLHLPLDQLNTVINERGWKRTVDSITFDANECNQPRAKKLAQRV
eukprot:CAMPEP_0174245074 /NCGR_PEP_ID=MMETSP0417-20130205/37551_1 /TAXON_ID=242541 /ORGANISM="Mayorella sp, Strain BSH-02190019" /LENGTH=210 /DNA_ID=CAMNT_0015324823 /DNA_START=87 /DNA_END=716 /DNA_ORIENTATION=-